MDCREDRPLPGDAGSWLDRVMQGRRFFSRDPYLRAQLLLQTSYPVCSFVRNSRIMKLWKEVTKSFSEPNQWVTSFPSRL